LKSRYFEGIETIEIFSDGGPKHYKMTMNFFLVLSFLWEW